LRGISADIQQMALFTANRLGDINAETPVIFDSVRRAAIDLLGSAPEIRQVLVLGQNNQVLFDSSGQAAIGTALRDEDFLRMGLGRTAPLSLDGTSRLGHPVPDRYLTVGQPATTEQEIPNGRWTIPIMVTSESLNSGLLVSPRNRRDASRATVIAALNPGFLIEQMREASSLKGMEGVIVRVDGVMLAGLPSNKAYDRLRAGREAFGSPSVSVRPDLVALLRGAQTQTLSTALPLSGFQGPMAVSIEENQPFAIMIGFDERAITARWWEDNRTIILVLIGLPLAPIGMILFLSRLAMDKARLQQEIEVLSRAVEQAPVCVIITDRMGRIDYVNPAFTRTFGWPRKEVLGLTPRL
ncbi:MAG: PAS domain S-box protein, partial [Rhodospirillaceae bacterium]